MTRPVRAIEMRSFLLRAETGLPWEVYPPAVNNNPTVRVDLYEPDDGIPGHKTAAVMAHPTVPVAGFYMFEPLKALGLPCLAVATRFLGNDSTLNMERCAQDLGTAIRFLTERGYEHIVLLGFSGGGSLATFYQAQAENLTATHMPDGRPSGLLPEHLPPADKIVLFGQHLGRSQTLQNVLDASVLDEHDLDKVDLSLDVFDPAHGPPFSDEFLARIREGQAARMQRITEWVRQRLAELEAVYGPGADEAFVVHRTNADPFMFADTSDFKGDREAIKAMNLAANGLGRFTSLRSWLSQWATGVSNADGPSDLARTTIPVLSIVQTGDHRAHPDYLRQWEEAMGERFTGHHEFDATHYMDPKAQAGMVAELAQLIHDFAMR
ncbi:alpha/beta hydrolase [Ilumatobacter coccineus]|uniref:Alpha/beta hydrolase n=1 Tax=Ilumatobacter coccineus (strain NBRC 103263 / KCTC 29153 / YM16-304) TaxID=1313172 RepID=A0A6C7E1U9_ILUCY|nr:hypothetical protein [Ilumatobacter coccineus]BAN00841.1 hypothetical protein YM304_05270 [Ilumatobacter coccineus YM16-304]